MSERGCPVTTTNLLWKLKRSFEKVYYKVWLTLLQSATALFITKCDRGVLQSATAILLQSVIEVTTKCDSANRAIFTGQNASHSIHTVKANSPANKQVQTGNRMDFLVGFWNVLKLPLLHGTVLWLTTSNDKRNYKVHIHHSKLYFQGRTDPGIPSV